MLRMLHGWGRFFKKSFGVAFLAALSLHAQSQDSVSVVPVSENVVDSIQVNQLPEDSLAMLDSLPSNIVENLVPDSLPSSEKVQEPELETALSTLQVDSSKTKKESSLKSVLYLGGGEKSPWFHLGVLYAIESYNVPVDSVVGVSWGAFVGYLWAKGAPLDDIQRILLDSDVAKVVGQNALDDLASPLPRKFEIPVSKDGIPSLRHRFFLDADSSGKMTHTTKSLEPDSAQVAWILSRLRLQESLYRQPVGFRIPFAVLGCGGELWNTAAKVIETLPLPNHENSGELCPYMALPLEDSPEELPIISVSVPVRYNGLEWPWRSPWQKVIASRILDNLNSQAGVIVRPHSVQDTSRNAWIQLGFSAMERKLAEVSAVRNREANYDSMKHQSVPWFRFTPVFDSLSAEKQSTAKTYWNPQDTGISAPRNFLAHISSRPAYDSLSLEMQPDGNVLVNASVRPTFDVFAGGFGSNVLGPNLYGGASISYVDQMEIDMEVAFFWGGRSYGIMPSLEVSRLWSRSWSFAVAYNWLKLSPLASSQKDTPPNLQVLSERRNDLSMAVGFKLDDIQKVSLNFLFGNHTHELTPLGEENPNYETHPVSPSLRYELLTGEGASWFSTGGVSATAEVGMQSIGFDFGLSDVIPIYWKFFAELGASYSPLEFLSFSLAAAGGLDTYHEEGFGYVYPKSFGMNALDNSYRQVIKATPWCSEWYDANLLSHNYGMLRLNGGLHYRGNGVWLFGAYIHDFEINPTASLKENRFVVEPALRLAYKSITAYFGMSRLVDTDSFADLKDLKNYRYFVRIGSYDLF